MEIQLTYIDDEIDITLSKFLAMKYNGNYEEYTFNCQNGYEYLLQDRKIAQANVIIIDSRLFENSHVANRKFTGEEFKLILKKVYPFVEVIVISQAGETIQEQIISKYKSTYNSSTAEKYYEENLVPEIERAIKNITAYNAIIKKLEENENVESLLVEQIKNSLNGIICYDGLKSSDVDELIKNFEELNKILNG